MSAPLTQLTAKELSKIVQPLLLKITYVKCGLHTRPVVRETLQALGLNKLHQTIIHKNVRPIRGMVNKVCPGLLPIDSLLTHPQVKFYIKVEPLEYIPKL